MKNRTYVFSVLVLCFLLFTLTVTCKVRFLESENRYANGFSVNSPEEYFTDRFPFREELLKLRRDINFLLFINEFSGRFMGKDGYVFSADNCDIKTLERNLDMIEVFAQKEAKPVYISLIGSKLDILKSQLPRFYESQREDIWQVYFESELCKIDINKSLFAAANSGKYIFYRTDHHLTSLGSYYAYRDIVTAFSKTPYGARDFAVSVVKSDFSGSDGRGLLKKGNDKISLFRFKGDTEFLVENMDSGESFYGFYDFDKLKSSDPYGIFPIPDCGRVRITNGKDREKLLLICDSFGDSLCPFLARHFDIEVLDIRYYNGSVEETEYNFVLFCFGIDTLSEREIMYRLK